MVVSEIKLAVTKTINLGNYENVKFDASVTVGLNDDDDTSAKMRERALEEISDLLVEAEDQHIPKRKLRGSRTERSEEQGGYR